MNELSPIEPYLSDPQQSQELAELAPIKRITAVAQEILCVEHFAEIPRLHPEVAQDLTERGFQLLPKTLGAGEFGTVYKVKDAVGNLHALKVIQQPEDLPYSPIAGPHLAARVQHPNIMAPELIYYQEARTEAMTCKPKKGDYCIAILLPYFDGKTVEEQWELIQKQPKLMFWILKEVALGVKALSQNDVEHNDLDPKNIMVNLNDLRISIIDFDLAHVTNPQTLHSTDRYALRCLAKHLIANASLNEKFSDFANSQFKQERIQCLSKRFDFEGLKKIKSKADEQAAFQSFAVFAATCFANVANLIKEEDEECAAAV